MSQHKGAGHLARWMDDATNGAISNAVADVDSLDAGEAGDVQAARELVELGAASRRALGVLQALHDGKHSGGACPNVYKCDSAAAGVIRELEDALLALEAE